MAVESNRVMDQKLTDVYLWVCDPCIQVKGRLKAVCVFVCALSLFLSLSLSLSFFISLL